MTLTTKLHNGREVTAKVYKGDILPKTYANFTQARRAADKLGSGWTVAHFGFSRIFYVTPTTV